MSGSGNGNGKKKTKDTAAAEIKDEQQVDELLRAAQDDMLLKLSLNSHMARGFGSSSQFSGVDPDLESRFQALKKPHQPKPKPKPKSNLDAATTRIGSEKRDPDQSDDLFARFAALKGSLPSYSAAAAPAVGISNISDQVQQQQQQVLMNDDNEEDEVEKVIKWAIDAARLDPSPPSDSDDNGDEHSDDDHSDDTDDDRGVDAGKKRK